MSSESSTPRLKNGQWLFSFYDLDWAAEPSGFSTNFTGYDKPGIGKRL